MRQGYFTQGYFTLPAVGHDAAGLYGERMMAIKIDLTGKRFGMLTATGKYERRINKSGRSYYYWFCKCDCGRELWVRGNILTSKHTQSCGHHNGRPIHNMSNTRLYSIHHGMKQRCENPKNQNYKSYGGRGITVCSEWNGKEGFIHFAEWALSNGYSDHLTIERIDVNGNYCPENCKWIPQKEQSLNKRTTVYIDDKGTPLMDVVKESDKKYGTVRGRKQDYGWSGEDLNDPVPQSHLIEYEGKLVTVDELSQLTGISKETLKSRVARGYKDEDMAIPTNSALRIPVEQYDMNGKYIATYSCIREAYEKTGVSMSGIAMCTSGRRKSCRGFIWKKMNVEQRERKERCLRRKEGGGWIDNRGKILNKEVKVEDE